jgi:predicted Fe-Mo cluster-binding NifX family protein
MELLIGISSNDGQNLLEDHVGNSKYFYVYRFTEQGESFVERRKNIKFHEDESIKHGDPGKAQATAEVLKGLDAITGLRFGPNINRLLKKYVCIIIKRRTVEEAITVLRVHIEHIVQAKEKGENRKHLILS